jgi:hypothetical protein
MASLVLGTAGAIVGGIYGGPTGAQIGWAIGSAIGGAIDPKKSKQTGPRLNDLKLPGVQYGDPIPFIMGRYRTAGQIWWASAKREISTVTNQDAGGKGGGPTVEQTTYTYEIDLLIGLTDHEIAGVPRAWLNGKLIYITLSSEAQASLLGETEDESFIARALSNVAASQNTAIWRRFTVYTGTATQLPDPTYEAAVGSANAVAYRNRSYVFIEGLQLGGAPAQLPNMEFEVCTKATGAQIDSNVMVQCEFDGGSENDISTYGCTDNGAVMGAQVVSDGDGGYALSANVAGAALAYSGGDLDNDHEVDHWTGECYVKHSGGAAFSGGYRIMLLQGSSGDDRLSIVMNTLSVNYLKLEHRNTFVIDTSDAIVPLGVWVHLAVVYEFAGGASGTVRVYINGVKTIESTSSDSPFPLTNTVWTLGVGEVANVGQVLIDDARLSIGMRYTGDSFTPPTRGGLGDPTGGDTLTPADEDLEDFFTETWASAGGSSALLDTSGLSSVTRQLKGVAATQVTSTRSLWEVIATGYFLEFVVSDKLYIRPRASVSVDTIPYEDLGASISGNVEPLSLKLNSDIEIPAQFSLTYSNLSSDYNADTQFSDRLVTAVDESVETIQLPLVLVPSEAKLVVDAIMGDRATSVTQTKISVLGEYTHLEPTDVITVEDEDDTQYRLRIVRKTDNYPLLEFEAVIDDATIVESEQITSDDYTPVIDVDEPSDTVLRLMDIAIGRDADDDSGFYVAAKGDPNPWPGCAVMKSSDDISYSSVATITESAVIGTATALGDWDEGRVFDELNSTTVSVGDGTLTSSTRSAVLANKLLNCMLVGDEIIQFVTATLVSTGVYKLTRLLRGCRGTDWAMTGHTAGERCVLLRETGGVRRVSMENAELGIARYYAGVTFGRTLSSALTGSPASGQSFTNNAVGKKPFSPVGLRIVRDSSNNITGTFHRRTRLSCRFAGSLGINVPLGETTESYEIDVFPVGSPNGLLRTIEVTDESFSYSAANQTTDGATPGDQFVFNVYQISATVDRGYALEKTA